MLNVAADPITNQCYYVMLLARPSILEANKFLVPYYLDQHLQASVQ